MSDSTDISHWIDLVKAGDSAAAERIWRHYFERLVRSVRARLRGSDQAVSDEEDIALSVSDSFYEAAEQGRFPDLSDRDDLWRLLLRMAARKVVDKRRRDRRQRRGGDLRVHSLDDSTGGARDGERVLEAIGDEPSPEIVLMMQEAVQRLFSRIGGGPLVEIAVAKLEGYSNAEIARRFGCSQRTVERRLHLIREKCQQETIETDEHPPEEVTDRGAGTHR
jgi:DNA-directed RNA polymerase specialized sigma24 family protein